MSCQQASRYITNINKNCSNLHNNSNIIQENRIARVVQPEDPYVFTESVPTTPPILFNTQKARTRLNDITSTTTLSVGKLQQQKLPFTETNGKIAAASNVIKTQASLVTTSTINNVTQSLTTTTTQLHSATSNNKKLTNVCIVRPQLQQQQPHYHHYQQQRHLISSTCEGDLKSISPPPLYTPPTPSLWQTPLLLETTAAGSSPPPQVANVAPQPAANTTHLISPIMGCVTPTVQTVGSTAATTMNPSLTTTAMAKVAPIIVQPTSLMPSSTSPAAEASLQSLNQCLPPSKFHNHTFAQHIQKVECLKKSKKLIQQLEIVSSSCNDNVMKIISSPHHQSAPTSTVSLQSMDCTSPVKHSDTEDLNEIPVNVIFRMALVPQQQKNEMLNEKSPNNIKLLTSANNNNNNNTTTQPQIKSNVNKKCSTPAPKTTANQILKQQQQINTSSIQQQQHNATKLALKLTHQQEQEQKLHPPQESKIKNLEPLTNTEEKPISIIKSKNATHTLNKSRKLNTSLTNLICDLPYNWQMGCSTTKGAVAIVKMSQYNLDLDITPLATAAGLPYCLQQHWFNSYDFRKSSDLAERTINRSLAREERIALYKQQLRRQTMQLLSTRSLQKLPLQVARRRILCVDRLLKKYQQNEKELPAYIKRCCVNGCDSYTLEMASHCQKHIVYNAAQHVFLPCTAKFADNTQCRVPVFDINHDLPLCVEHARKRDAYNRLLYEQRPRKISAPTSLIMNEPVAALNVSATGGVVGGLVIKTQQQQQQHNLEQLSLKNNSNNNNSNKRPTLVNQLTRKRKINVGGCTGGNPVGRPQKRVKKSAETPTVTTTQTNLNHHQHQMPRLTPTNLKRKSSTTSLESIATSNSQHSTTSSTSQQPQQPQQQKQQQQRQQQRKLYGLTSSSITTTASSTTSLPPPALAPLSSGLMVGHHGLPQHLYSFGHDNHHPINNINNKHSFSSSASSTTPTELKDFISQFSFVAHKNRAFETTDVLNTNSNSNFTSSVMGSTTSLPTADDFLTQDMLSICENSSASSADTGLGGLSDPELMLGGPEDDIPLGDTHLLEEHDLANVLNSLPEDAFKELFATVHQDESDEIERAIELADKHLKTLQQTIGSELGDFLDFNDDMLMDNSDMCNASTVSSSSILDTSALYIGVGGAASAKGTTHGGAATIAGGLVQT